VSALASASASDARRCADALLGLKGDEVLNGGELDDERQRGARDGQALTEPEKPDVHAEQQADDRRGGGHGAGRRGAPG
jgi:hypothetical protein